MSPWDKRERNRPWYLRWIEPVTAALYTHDLVQARQLLYAARHAIVSGEIPPGDDALKAGYLLDYMEFMVAKVADPLAALEQCAEFEQRLTGSVADPSADSLRRKLLLQFRCSAERLGYRDLEIDDFQALYDGVPPADRNDEFWYFVSNWAFDHFHRGILEQAYEQFSFNVGKFMRDWLYWRVRMMFLLSTETATEEDVEHLVDNLALQEHLNDFRHRFIPALKHAGLWTPVLIEQLEVRRVDIEGKGPEEIKRELAE